MQAALFYLAVYLFANLAAFAVVIAARARDRVRRRHPRACTGSAPSRPLLALAMTLSMLSLAGIPATAGFIGKFRLIEAAADGGYTWLGIVIVIGSMISLAYYLPVVAAMWREAAEPRRRGAGARRGAPAGPALAGGAPRRRRARLEARGAARRAALRRRDLFFGIVPQPLFNLVERRGTRARAAG